MQTNNWDLDAQQISKAILALEQECQALQREEARRLMQKKMAISQVQITNDRILQKLQALPKQRFVISSQGQALIHWCAVFAEKALVLYKKQSRVNGQQMWLQLLKVRLQGPSQSPGTLLEDSDVMEMALRQSNLKKTESFLSDQLVRSKLRHKEVERQYEIATAKLSNARAAASLQARLGRNLNDSLANPRYKALETYFRWLTAPIRGTTASEKHLQSLRKKLSDETHSLINACRNMILGQRGLSRWGSGDNSLKKLQNTLHHLDDLQQEIDRTTQEVLNHCPPPPAPIVMKKNYNQATRNGYS